MSSSPRCRLPAPPWGRGGAGCSLLSLCPTPSWDTLQGPLTSSGSYRPQDETEVHTGRTVCPRSPGQRAAGPELGPVSPISLGPAAPSHVLPQGGRGRVARAAPLAPLCLPMAPAPGEKARLPWGRATSRVHVRVRAPSGRGRDKGSVDSRRPGPGARDPRQLRREWGGGGW